MKDKQTKQAEAKARNESWASLSPKQQLASLDNRGMEAAKQRAKIKEKIDKN